MAIARFKDFCIDAVDGARATEFWGQVLNLEPHVFDDGDGKLSANGQVLCWVNRVPEQKTVKNRLHLDLETSDFDAVLAAGAELVDAESFPWRCLRDPDGQEFCVFVRDEPTPTRLYELVWDCTDGAEGSQRIAAWWEQLLGAHRIDDERGFSYLGGIVGAPFDYFDFIPVPEPKTVKNRVHIDVTADALQPLLDAGAVLLRAKEDDIQWHVLADPDGNEFCAFTPD